MVQFSIEKRTDIVEFYITTRSIKETNEMFQDKYPHDKIPTASTIQDLYTKCECEEQTSNSDDPEGSRSRQNSNKHNEKPQKIDKEQFGVSRTTCHRVLSKDLKFRPFGVSVVHELREPDKGKRITFCNWLLSSIVEGSWTQYSSL
ncbi:hypothetical protein C0J52_15520 [Blattella germanica]|nr:hypothetical protein C0J52_15520 [Blattella germanica]